MSILDASIILKWFVDEEDSGKALRLREEHYKGKREVIVPDLLLYEVSNALRYNPDFKEKEIEDSIETLFNMDIDIIVPTYTLIKKAIEIAVSNDITCYDATYIALAQDLKFAFITADEKLYNKLLDTAKSSVDIKLLSQLFDEKELKPNDA